MGHNWYIGQDIVCIKTHSEGIVKEGEIFTVKALKENFCKCGGVMIHVGILSEYEKEECCGVEVLATDNFYWLHEDLFAPLDTLTDIREIEEILSQPIEQLFKI